jgi:histone acetyltransferase
MVCADNYAVNFFKKQGFSDRAITMDSKRWVGRIQDYENVTLMYCQVYPEVDYIDFQRALDKQIEFLESQIGRRSFPGVFGKDSLWEPYNHCPPFLCRPFRELVPMFALGERRADAVQAISDYYERMSEMKPKCKRILDEFQEHSLFAVIFDRSVTEAFAPNYFKKVQRPMDFCTMRKRLRRCEDYYKRREMFAVDIPLSSELQRIIRQKQSIMEWQFSSSGASVSCTVESSRSSLRTDNRENYARMCGDADVSH